MPVRIDGSRVITGDKMTKAANRFLLYIRNLESITKKKACSLLVPHAQNFSPRKPPLKKLI